MQIHLIGHASVFIETQDCRILMDPVLWDSHCEGIEDICPKRQVIHEQIPEFDILIISHRHTDHFDIRSLANLPKHVDVLIPKDEFMEDCLRRLGYRHIYCLKDFNKLRIGSTHLLTTRSENRVPEFGMLFADNDGVFWNQVDSIVNSQTISQIKSDYSQIDFLLATWQPMLETQYQYNQDISFPYLAYSNILQLINLVSPRAIAPGANGFKLINGSSWLNQITFPVTREQFCKDVKQVYPEIHNQVFIFDPGDIISLNKHQINHRIQQSNFVKKLADDYDSLYFSPVNIDSKLKDDNPDRYDIQEMKNVIFSEVCTNLPHFIQSHKDSLFLKHFQWKIIYQLEVVFPSNSEIWYFDFNEDIIQCHKGRNPLANTFSYISASSFYGILKGFKGWDWANMGGYHRCFHKIYKANYYGIIEFHKKEYLEDILHLKFPYKQVYKKVRNFEIEKWGHHYDNKLVVRESKNIINIFCD